MPFMLCDDDWNDMYSRALLVYHGPLGNIWHRV